VFGLSQIGGGHGGDAAAALSTTTLVVSLSVGAVSLGLFVWRQLRLQRFDDALLDLRVFRFRNFSLSVVHLTFMSMAFFGTITVLPLYTQRVLGLTALESGLVVLPGALAMGLAGPLIGRVYDRWGTRVLLIPGSVMVVLILWLFTGLTESTPVWLLVIAQTALSLGLAMSFTPLLTASLGSLPPRLYSHGSAMVTTIQQVSGAAGIAVLITTLSSASATAADAGAADLAAGAAGTRAAFLVAAIISLPLLVGAVLIRKPADAPAELPAGH